MLVLVLGNKISPNDKKNTHCNNLDLLKELMLKLRSSYLLNIYLIHVVWNHVDKKMLVFYENVYKIMRALISLHGYWWKRNTRWIHILILVGFVMYRFLPGLFYDTSTICKHWFYYEIIFELSKMIYWC